jgi:Flp pilus assembly protein TadD
MSQAIGFFNAGTEALNAGRLSTAVDLLERATAADGEMVVLGHAWRNLGIALRRTGDDEAALRAFQSALDHDPNDLATLYSQGNTLMALGRHGQALAAFQAVRQGRPTFAEAANNEGAIWMALGCADKAEACFAEAVAIDPDYAQAWSNLAVAGAAIGRQASPLQTLKQAQKLAPNNLDIRAKMGHLLTELGHFDAAIRTFRAVTNAAPSHPDAKAGLSLALYRAGDTIAALAAIAPAIATGSPSADEAVAYGRICLAMNTPMAAIAVLKTTLKDAVHPATKVLLGKELGQLLDATGQADAAFVAISQANTARNLRFDAVAHRQRIERIIEDYDPDLMTSTCKDETPVFIVGVPRSGTSLIEQMLDGHPHVFGAGERGDLQMIAAEMGRVCETEAELTAFAQAYLDRIRPLSPNAKRITDKMPSNFLLLGEAARLFPNARVIHCVRDPADTGLSCLFQHFKDTLPWATRQEDIAAFVSDYHMLMAHWAAHNPLRILTVPYEALVRDPAHWARRMSVFLGLRFDEAMLYPEHNSRAVRTASFAQVRQPIHTRSIGRHQAYFEHIPQLICLQGSLQADPEFLPGDNHAK